MQGEHVWIDGRIQLAPCETLNVKRTNVLRRIEVTDHIDEEGDAAVRMEVFIEDIELSGKRVIAFKQALHDMLSALDDGRFPYIFLREANG